MAQDALPQDYYEPIPADRRQIHATKRFGELNAQQEERRDRMHLIGHTCRYCNTVIPPKSTVCMEHLGIYQQYRKKAKRQAQRLCELARQRRMVTQSPTRSAQPVTI